MSTVVCGGAVDLHHAFVGSGKVYSHILQVNSAMKSKTASFTFIMSHNLPDCSKVRNTTECNVIDCDCMECGHCWLLLVVCVLCSWCWWVWIWVHLSLMFLTMFLLLQGLESSELFWLGSSWSAADRLIGVLIVRYTCQCPGFSFQDTEAKICAFSF